MTLIVNQKVVTSLAKGTALAGVLAIGATLSACSSTPKMVSSCDGKPDWCVIVANEVANPTSVYVDGQKAGTVPAEATISVPVPAGGTHAINYCKEVRVNEQLFGLWSDKKILCTKPESVEFTKNKNAIIYDSNNFTY